MILWNNWKSQWKTPDLSPANITAHSQQLVRNITTDDTPTRLNLASNNYNFGNAYVEHLMYKTGDTREAIFEKTAASQTLH